MDIRTVVAAETGRVDKLLQAALPDLSRSRIQQLIGEGYLTIGGTVVIDAARKARAGDELALGIPLPISSTLKAQDIPLVVVYEDAHLLVIDKPAGMTVHPGPGNPDGTLVNALLAHCGDTLSGIGGVERPGIVHRLDKETSGLMVVAKHDRAHRRLSRQLSLRTLGRTYLAFCWNKPRRLSGTIETQIGRSPRDRKKMAVLRHGGREAITHYEVVAEYPTGPSAAACLIECKLATGRTHQIRVHMTHIGLPLIGDPVYGHAPRGAALSALGDTGMRLCALSRQALHAAEIRFVHPESHKEMRFQSPLPPDLTDVRQVLEQL